MVVIRLARGGRKNRPFYFIHVTDKRARRDGRHIEKIGSYNPFSKAIILDLQRLEYWVGVGAIPSDTVKSIVKRYKAQNKANASDVQEQALAS